MKIDLKSAGLGLLAGLAVTSAAAQAMQGQDHQHQAPAAKQGQMMQSMPHDRMMNDPAMRRQMMERMRQCHDMMSQMMAHMEQAEHPQPQAQPQPQPR